MLFAFVLLVVWAAPSVAVSNFHQRNTSGLLFLYGFQEGQQSTELPTRVRDLTGLNLLGDLLVSTTGAVAWSAEQQGMTIPSVYGGSRAMSEKKSDAVIAELTTEFSVELWITNTDIDVWPLSYVHLIGFVDLNASNSNGNCRYSSDGGYTLTPTPDRSYGGFKIQSRQGTITYALVDVLTNTGDPCAETQISVFPEYQTKHVVLRMKPGSISFVSEGGLTTVSASQPMLDPSIWHPEFLSIGHPKYIASPPRAWIGTMHMAAMYNRYLTTEEIAELQAMGPPNSLPSTSVMTHEGLEDEPWVMWP